MLFAVTTFASAGLVFMVQPMVAKLVLPLLGGSSSVWNTSIAFFQTALLVGYGYAHLLQRVKSVRTQALVHVAALLIAALALPLRVTGRARHANARTSGYSQTLLKITGARKALNAPPTTPPNDIQR